MEKKVGSEMGIFREDVVHVDPTGDRRDVVSATAASGTHFGTVSVTHRADFGNDMVSNAGTTQSVCVRPGDEHAFLAQLGGRLCKRYGDSPGVYVTDVEKFAAACQAAGLTDEQIATLEEAMTKSPDELNLDLV